jgi:hypothetical protein
VAGRARPAHDRSTLADRLRRDGIPTRPAQGPLLQRAWTRAKIDQLTADYRAMRSDADGRAPAQAEIVALSTRERVLSEFTALLVLETDRDYARFGIERTALADILTVGPAGVTLLNRSEPDGQPSPHGEAVAREVGVLPALEQAGTYAVGEDDQDVWGGLTGTEIGEVYGFGGLGLIEHEEGTIGLGNTGGRGVSYGRSAGASFGSGDRRRPQVAHARPTVTGSLDLDIVRRIVRARINEVRFCYQTALTDDDELAGRVAVDFVISAEGKVASSVVQENTTASTVLGTCIAKRIERWTFPKPSDGGTVTVRYPFVLSSAPPASASQAPRGGRAPVAKPATVDPYTGRFAEIMKRLGDGEAELALSEAWQWREREPASEFALLALGEAAEAHGSLDLANRAYGSLIDLFPARADIRRMAGQRLERVAEAGGSSPAGRAALELAIDSYRVTVEQRPDHPSSHRLYAYALVKAGRHEDAFMAIFAGATRSYPPSRLLGVIHWETDANDVDFHIYDSEGGHAYHANKRLRSGGRLYADVTNGYGPECFTIEGTPSAGPYTLQAHYFSMGPMGYGMGKLQILRHDGKGGLSFEERPFVIMRDRAFVDLGTFEG